MLVRKSEGGHSWYIYHKTRVIWDAGIGARLEALHRLLHCGLRAGHQGHFSLIYPALVKMTPPTCRPSSLAPNVLDLHLSNDCRLASA